MPNQEWLLEALHTLINGDVKSLISRQSTGIYLEVGATAAVDARLTGLFAADAGENANSKLADLFTDDERETLALALRKRSGGRKYGVNAGASISAKARFTHSPRSIRGCHGRGARGWSGFRWSGI